MQSKILWDRKTEGGFPEVKELKRRVRDIIDPSRDLGHVDGKKKPVTSTSTTSPPAPTTTTASHINSQEGDLEHSKRSIEEQPGGRRNSIVDEVPVSAGVCDGRKRNEDGSICEDCV